MRPAKPDLAVENLDIAGCLVSNEDMHSETSNPRDSRSLLRSSVRDPKTPVQYAKPKPAPQGGPGEPKPEIREIVERNWKRDEAALRYLGR